MFVIFAWYNQNKGIDGNISAEVLLKLAILHLLHGWLIQLITAIQMVVIKGHSSIFIYFCCFCNCYVYMMLFFIVEFPGFSNSIKGKEQLEF